MPATGFDPRMKAILFSSVFGVVCGTAGILIYGRKIRNTKKSFSEDKHTSMPLAKNIPENMSEKIIPEKKKKLTEKAKRTRNVRVKKKEVSEKEVVGSLFKKNPPFERNEIKILTSA